MSDGLSFERAVEHTIHNLFQQCKITRSALVQIVQGKDPNEIDFIVEFEDIVFLMEVTVDTSLSKAKYDIDKMRNYRKSVIYPNQYGGQKGVRAFFVTPTHPSAHVLNYAEESGSWIRALSLGSFISEFSGAGVYVHERKNKEFGSVRDPITDGGYLDRNFYVDVPVINRKTGAKLGLVQAYEAILSRKMNRFVLTGDFGVGKSMFFRELFYRLSDAFEQGKSQSVPLYINARNVSFQDHNEPRDIIEDHIKWCGCRSISDKFSTLWPNGNIILMIDGFDEYLRDIPSVVGHSELAIASTQFIRKFLKEAPHGTPVLVCGRESYFDGKREVLVSLLGTEAFEHFSTSEMTEKHTRMILTNYYKLPKSQVLPDWLPFRPLLLTYIFGYLHNSRVRNEGGVLYDLSVLEPGKGWNTLLDRICRRDAETKSGGSDPAKSRKMLEVLSIRARDARFKGVFDQNDIMDVYRYVYGSSSTYYDIRAIMRHCGLVPATTELTRRFVDENFGNALSGGALISALEECLSGCDREKVAVDLLLRLYNSSAKPITSLGIDVAIDRLGSENYQRSFLSTFRSIFTNPYVPPQLRGDAISLLLRLCEQADQVIDSLDMEEIIISSASFEEISLEKLQTKFPRIKFVDCMFGEIFISVAPEVFSEKFSFTSCVAEELTLETESGWSINDPVSGLQAQERKVTTDTNAEILASDLPEGVKALKICLNKLYDQAGSGRNITAFYRGIGRLPRYLIDDVLSDLIKAGLAYEIRRGSRSTVIHSTRHGRSRAEFIVRGKSGINDHIYLKYKEI